MRSDILLGSFGILAAASVAIVDAIESVGGNLCNTNDGAVLVQEIVESKDATIFQGQDKISSGEDLFMIGTTKNGIRRGLLAFAFKEDDFPPDAQVECTEIRLHVGQTGSNSDDSVQIPEIVLHRITTAWETSGSNILSGVNGGNVKNGDTTWAYTDYPTSTWKERGGDFADTVVATKFEAGDIHSFGNTLRMARIVQEWIQVGTNPFNAGFMFVGEENASSDKHVRYNGIENAPDLIPRLIVTYTSPSQGKDHRDYTGYLPEGPSSSSQHNNKDRNEFLRNGLCFAGGIIFGGLVVVLYFIRCRRGKLHEKSEEAIEIDTSSEKDLQLAEQDAAEEDPPVEIGEIA